VHLHPTDARIGAGEVDVLEDAESAASGGNRLCRVQAVRVDPDELAGLDVAYDVGADEVERARLGGDGPVVAETAERERPESERVAERDERPVDDGSDRVGTL
jgi:hypothetical protein